jgi:DNA/RNA endonuclease YhcR with UshA esterase domain
MDEPKLLAISLAISTIGLILLLFVSATQQPMPISAITPDDIGSKAFVKGAVSELRMSPDGHLFFVLSDGEGSIKAVAFADVAKDLPCVENGRVIEMRGFVDEYRGEIEIIPSKAEDVKC